MASPWVILAHCGSVLCHNGAGMAPMWLLSGPFWPTVAPIGAPVWAHHGATLGTHSGCQWGTTMEPMPNYNGATLVIIWFMSLAQTGSQSGPCLGQVRAFSAVFVG